MVDAAEAPQIPGGFHIAENYGPVHSTVNLFSSDNPEIHVINKERLRQYTAQPNLDEEMDLLKKERMLILESNPDIEVVEEVAIYLAKQWQTWIEAMQDKPAVIHLWQKRTEANFIIRRIQDLAESDNPILFILPNLAPRDLSEQVSLPLIKTYLGNTNSLIMTTTHPLKEWEGANLKKVWRYPDPDKIYEKDSLYFALRTELQDANNATARRLYQQLTLEDHIYHLEETIRNGVFRLRTPSRVTRFITRLGDSTDIRLPDLPARKSDESSEEYKERIQKHPQWEGFKTQIQEYIGKIFALMEACGKSKVDIAAFTRWYLRCDDRRLQMLALAATLFQGLSDSQFFAMLELLADREWGRRENALIATDYQDLEPLGEYFSFNGQVRSFIWQPESPRERLRYHLFDAAWNKTRRQILTAVRRMTMLGEEIAENRSTRFEIFNSTDKRFGFWLTLSQLLSDLSLSYFDDIEADMYRLALQDDLAAQETVALALARWQVAGKSVLLAEVLQRWWQNALQSYIINTIISENSKSIDEQRRHKEQNRLGVNLRLTVLNAVVYALRLETDKAIIASEANSTNGEDADRKEGTEALYNLFTDISMDPAPPVSARFGELLPTLLVRHFNAMLPRLRNLIRYDFDGSLITAVSNSLAYAHNFYPDQVQEVLDRWRKEFSKETPSETERGEFRERILIIIATTYSKLTEPTHDNA